MPCPSGSTHGSVDAELAVPPAKLSFIGVGCRTQGARAQGVATSEKISRVLVGGREGEEGGKGKEEAHQSEGLRG